MNRFSIRQVGPFLIVLPALLVSIAFGVLASWEGASMVDDLTGQIINQVTGRAEAELHSYLVSAVRVSDHTEAMIAANVLDPERLQTWKPTIQRQLKAQPTVSYITFGNTQGDATWVIRYPDEPDMEYALKDQQTRPNITEFKMKQDGTLGPPISEWKYDPLSRPWYQAALKANGPTWSKVYNWERRNLGIPALGISYARPIRTAKGKLLGVLDCGVDLAAVSDFLTRLDHTKKGRVFLVGPEGFLIAASSSIPVVTQKGKKVVRVRASAAEDALLAAVAGQIENETSYDQITLPQSWKMSVEEQRYRVEAAPLRSGGSVSPHETEWNLDWRLVVVVPEEEVMSGVVALQRRFWIIGALLILGTLILGVVASQALVWPVLGLVEAVRRIGQGDLDYWTEVGGGREFTLLSRELNKMAADLKDRMRIKQSLALAMEIQQKLLPSESPRIAGLDIAGQSNYCEATGGDYYDFLELDESNEGDLIVAVGDVMGHGVAAALLMATARGTLRSRATESGSLCQLITHLNEQLVVDTDGERFMTMILLVVDAQQRRICWTSAGHDTPLLYDPGADQFVDLPQENGLPLGILAGAEYQEVSQENLQAGHILLVGTDGIWETHNPEGEQFGKDRLCDLIRSVREQPAAQISKAITTALAEYRGGAHQDDDITFVLIKFINREGARGG